MPSFSIKVSPTPWGGDPPGFTVDQMRGLGVGIINEMEARMDRGDNIYDQQAKPLSARHAKAKIRIGANPIRDFRYTGLALGSLVVLDASAFLVKVGFNNSLAYQHALFAQNIDPEFGLSPKDQSEVLGRIQETYATNVKDMHK
jgi:hypothetical protein